MAGHAVILLVQGNPDEATLWSLAFEEAFPSASVHLVPDGNEARKYLQGFPPYDNRARFPVPKLVLVDLMLHGMTAFELLDWVRLDPTFTNLPIGVLGEPEQELDIRKAHTLGADFHLIKPFSFREMVAIIQRLSVAIFA